MSKGVAKPFLKWAGGKGQLLNKFEEIYPLKKLGLPVPPELVDD
jgi:hypothetical protein